MMIFQELSFVYPPTTQLPKFLQIVRRPDPVDKKSSLEKIMITLRVYPGREKENVKIFSSCFQICDLTVIHLMSR